MNNKKKNRVMPAIAIQLLPSRLILGVLLLISMLACVSVIILSIPLAIKLCLLLLVVVSTIYFMLRDALRLLPWSWQRVAVSSTGELRLTNQRGQTLTPSLHASTFIHPALIILNIQKAGIKQRLFGLPAVLILPSFNTEQHRQLRVWLKWWQHEEG